MRLNPAADRGGFGAQYKEVPDGQPSRAGDPAALWGDLCGKAAKRYSSAS